MLKQNIYNLILIKNRTLSDVGEMQNTITLFILTMLENFFLGSSIHTFNLPVWTL